MAALECNRKRRQQTHINPAAVIPFVQHTFAKRLSGPAPDIAIVKSGQGDEVFDLLQRAHFGLGRDQSLRGQGAVILGQDIENRIHLFGDQGVVDIGQLATRIGET